MNLDGTVLTVAFDDAGTDFVSISMNATGYQTTGANVSSGTGTITKLVVTDAGTTRLSSVEISDASQQLTGGLSVGQNVSSVEIAAADRYRRWRCSDQFLSIDAVKQCFLR